MPGKISKPATISCGEMPPPSACEYLAALTRPSRKIIVLVILAAKVSCEPPPKSAWATPDAVGNLPVVSPPT